MPLPALKSLAARAGVSLATAEKRWEDAKKIVKSEYHKLESDPDFWALVTGVTKRSMGLTEKQTFKQFLESRKQ